MKRKRASRRHEFPLLSAIEALNRGRKLSRIRIIEGGADVTAGDLSRIEQLLQEGADVNVQRSDDGMTPLLLACKKGWFFREVSNLLLAHGANVNAQGMKDGWTPVFWAYISGCEDLAKLIITEHGGDLNIPNYNGDTVLHYACSGGHASWNLKFLVDHGADVNLTNKNGETPLLVLCKKYHWSGGSPFPHAKILIEAGADVNAKNVLGETALHWACRKGFSDIVKLLLSQGAEVNAESLHAACKENRLEVAWLLIHHCPSLVAK